MIISRIAFVLCIFYTLVSHAQSALNAVQLDVKQDIVAKSKVLKVESQLYYNLNSGEQITRSTKPAEMYYTSNASGELKVYDPNKNTVIVTNEPEQSTNYGFLNMFLSNNKSDFNLKKAGFTLIKTEIDKDKNVISIYKKALGNKKEVYAKLVQENFLPIYICFYNEKNEIFSKTYYTDYAKVDKYQIPLKITEINILSIKKDSVIDRRIYSNIKVNSDVNPKLKSFKVPNDAKVLKP
jgi:outer membrane lipoprotein-sorting protein